MTYKWTSECVSSGHPDKMADQISDALLDSYLEGDPTSKVAIETLISHEMVVVAGEVSSNHDVDIEKVIRQTIKDIGYNSEEDGINPNTCQVIINIIKQSSQIHEAVCGKELGAGDQGIMFGYATNQTPAYMPLTIWLSRHIIKLLEIYRTKFKMPYLPDAKSQVTVEFDDNHNPIKIDTIVISTQHKASFKIEDLRENLKKEVLKDFEYRPNHDLLTEDTKFIINPAGTWTLGGPAADTGVTGRKIVIDNYGADCPIGGGAFSGKDASKVDRSAAYAARWLAKNIVASGITNQATVQLSYAIGLTEPLSIFVESSSLFPLKFDGWKEFFQENNISFNPQAIIDKFQLQKPIFLDTAKNGHFGLSHLPWEQLDIHFHSKLRGIKFPFGH